MVLKYISLGHRCHIASILKLNKMRNESLPFDNIIYSFEGVIDCFENDFTNFFPKEIKCEYIFVGKNNPEANADGNRKLFRGKYGCFTHHDLENSEIIDTFKRRIKRLVKYLSETNDEIIFCRTVMDDDEIYLLEIFIKNILKLYPNLNFKIFLIYDNKNIPDTILYYNEYAFIVNSCMITTDQNKQTNPTSYNFLFNYLKNINKIDDIKINEKYFNSIINFKNDNYKGYAIKDGILPYDINN